MKKAITLLLLTSMLMSATACQGSGTSNGSSNTDSSTEQLGEVTRSDEQYNFTEIKANQEIELASGGSFTLTIDEDIQMKNFIKIEYTTDISLLGSINYAKTEDVNVKKTEPMFIQKDVKEDFYQIIDSKYSNAYDKTLTSIVFENVDNKSGIFNIESVKIGEFEAFVEDEIYFSNDYLKVGISMSSGGAINYLENVYDNVVQVKKADGTVAIGVDYDEEYEDSTLLYDEVNLVNSHDKGRLIQQSYYGIVGAPYENGVWSGKEWGYNPVQGGDSKNTSSILCDYAMYGDTVYVKAMPMDWAKTGSVTPSYMENWYMLEDDMLHTKNRFIDFSGYNHNMVRDQELPAVYPVAPFHTFAGVKGDSGDIYYNDSLGFWGDEHTSVNRWSDLNENWYAWVNEDGYGLGICAPDVTTIIMGRTKNSNLNFTGEASKTGASSYGAMLGRFSMVTYEIFEYDYFISVDYARQLKNKFNDITETHENSVLIEYESR